MRLRLCASVLCNSLTIVLREVHKAYHRVNGTVVALKRILMHNEKEGMPVTALREIKILKALKHPCIIDIHDMFVVRSTRLPARCLPPSDTFADYCVTYRSWEGVAFVGVHGVPVHGP